MPLVAFAAGSLLGGAFFHMLPAAFEQAPADPNVFLLTLIGFTVFFALEQFLHWHHCHRAAQLQEPLTYLILLGDALHLWEASGAGVFLIVFDWNHGQPCRSLAVPELGDFGVLIQRWNQAGLCSEPGLGSHVPAQRMVAYAAAARIDVGFLVPFAAGNFIYIAASDLVPEVNKHREIGANLIHFISFAAGIALLWAIRLAFAP
jgi:zinc and cadmium transporter